MKIRARTIAAAAAFAAAVASPAFAAPKPVTICGQVVKGSGILVADLDCSASAVDAVELSGRLLLNGFTLTGNPAFDVVRCKTGSCRVSGPGTVTGGMDGVRSDRSARVDSQAVVTGNVADGIRSDGSATLVDATVTANGGDGIRSKSRASARRSLVNDNGSDGIRADGSISATSSTVSGNAGNGLDSDRTSTATLSTITGNGFDGVRGLRVTLSASTATGNGVAPACATITDDCADLASAIRPAVRRASVCGTSRDSENGGPWGVCSDD